MPKIITLSLFNRPKYTIQVLDNLALCRGIQDYRVIPIIDVLPNSNNVEVMYEILQKYLISKKLNIDAPRIPDRNLGCNLAIYTCLNTGFLFTNYLIHIEDDILLAPDALEYFEWANKQYKDNKSVFTVDTYNNLASQGVQSTDYQTVSRAKSFKPWGWATWIDRWEEIKDLWQFGFEPRTINGTKFEGGGWDLCMKKVLRGDRYRIYPNLARCINIGAEQGAHTPSPEFHWAKHTVKNWAGNTKYDYAEFREDCGSITEDS